MPLALRGTRRVLRGDLAAAARAASALGRRADRAEGSELASASWRSRDRVADAIAAECGEPRLDLVAAGPERPAALRRCG